MHMRGFFWLMSLGMQRDVHINQLFRCGGFADRWNRCGLQWLWQTRRVFDVQSASCRNQIAASDAGFLGDGAG